MDNKYSQDQYQKFLQKKKEKQQQQKTSNLDDEVMQRAAELESETHQTAKQARQRLQESAQKQKLTTAELQAQGEKIENIRRDAHTVNVNVKEGHQLSKDIKQAGKLFGFKMPFVGKIKNMFGNREEKKMEKNFKRRHRSQEKLGREDGEDEEKNVHFSREEGIPGQEKTDEELMNIYLGLKGMKKEAKDQGHILHKQKGDISEIAKYNENSEKYINKTNTELRKL